MATQIQNTGLAITTLALTAQNTAKYVHWGTGSGQGVTATALAAASAEARTTGTISQQTTNTTSDTYRVVGTIVASATRAITEAAVFDAAAAGNMYVYGDFSVINLLSGDSIQFTINTVYDQG